jgi:hypothetical protein
MHACGVAPRDPVQDHSIPDWGAQENNRYGLCVPYRNDAGEEKIDYGHGVPLGVYRQEEIQQVVERCRVLLVENKIIQSSGDCVSFRCGGWMANDVLAAVQMVEPLFQYDASAVDASFLQMAAVRCMTGLLNFGDRKTDGNILFGQLSFLSAYPSGSMFTIMQTMLLPRNRGRFKDCSRFPIPPYWRIMFRPII